MGEPQPPQRHRLRRFIIVVVVLVVLALVGDLNHSNITGQTPPAQGISTSASATTSGHVIVVASDFTQNVDNAGDLISYGIILRNENSSVAAIDVKVTTTFVDSLSRSVGTDDQTITGIPPAGRFNVGGSIAPNVSLTVARLHVSHSRSTCKMSNTICNCEG